MLARTEKVVYYLKHADRMGVPIDCSLEGKRALEHLLQELAEVSFFFDFGDQFNKFLQNLPPCTQIYFLVYHGQHCPD